MVRFRNATLCVAGYFVYFLIHLITLPWLALRGWRGAQKRGYQGLTVCRLLGGSRPPQPGPWILCIGAHLGESRTALQAASEIAESERNPVAVLTASREAYDILTGRNLARTIGIAPFNNPISALTLLLRWRPTALLFTEYCDLHHLAFWAWLLGVKTLIINGRFSEADCARHRKSLLATWRYRVITKYGVQAETHRERLQKLGVEPERIHVTGPSLPGETYRQTDREGEIRKWRTFAARDEAAPILVAGSTYAEDERLVLDAFARLQEDYPEALLILAPRKLQRAGGCDSVLKEVGVRFVRRSETDVVPPDTPVALLDTMGELHEVYAIATAAFIGGSLDPRLGGHTPIEAMRWGVPMTIGPEVETQRALVDLLRQAGALQVCRSAPELASVWSRYAAEREHRAVLNARIQAIRSDHSNVFGRFYAEWLDKRPEQRMEGFLRRSIH